MMLDLGSVSRRWNSGLVGEGISDPNLPQPPLARPHPPTVALQQTVHLRSSFCEVFD
jgi:hypothetical protein